MYVLHHHAIQGLIDTGQGLEDRGKEAPGAQFGDQLTGADAIQ